MYTFYRTPTVRACLAVMLIAVLLPSLACAQLETDPTRESAASGRSVSGLGVFGEVGVHGTDTLVIWGDLVLEKAKVVGQGTLKLRGHRPAQIIAHRSTVPKLHVANPTRVTLYGDLQVTQQLAVEAGTLDARPGTLSLPTGEKLAISRTGKLIVNTRVVIAAAQSRASLPGPQQLDAEPVTGLIWPNESRRGAAIQPIEKQQSFRTERYRQEPTPPPEEGLV